MAGTEPIFSSIKGYLNKAISWIFEDIRYRHYTLSNSTTFSVSTNYQLVTCRGSGIRSLNLPPSSDIIDGVYRLEVEIVSSGATVYFNANGSDTIGNAALPVYMVSGANDTQVVLTLETGSTNWTVAKYAGGGGVSTVSVSNGLNDAGSPTDPNIELGGVLVKDTLIDLDVYELQIKGSDMTTVWQKEGAVEFRGSTVTTRIDQKGFVGINNLAPTSYLDVQGSFAAKTRIVTTSYTIQEDDYHIIVNSGATPVTLIFPPPNTCPGREVIVSRAQGCTGAVNLTAAGIVMQHVTGNYVASSGLGALNAYNQHAILQCDGARHMRCI